MDIEKLDLAPQAAQACRELQAAFPEVVFVSGRRRYWQQADAMARNHLLDGTYLVRTYRHGATLAAWIREECPPAWQAQASALAGLLLGAMLADRTLVQSAHLTGWAVDLQPMEDAEGIRTARGAAVVDWIRRDPRTARLLLREGGLRRWHWEIKHP